MKTLTNYITEAIKIGRSAKGISIYSCQPEDEYELMAIIKDRMDKEGNECNLNDIDTSKIEDMSDLFYGSDFNGNISDWDVSNVRDMSSMFGNSRFNQDISKWKIRKGCNIKRMFDYCPIKKDYMPVLPENYKQAQL